MMLRSNKRRPEDDGRSTGRRDLAVIVIATVIVFCLGVLAGAFTAWDRWLESVIPRQSPDVLGLLLLVSAAGALFGVLRSRAARREEVLRKETERRYQAVVEQVPAVTYTWDPTVPTGQAPPVYVSPQLELMLGYTPSEWSSDPQFWIERLHPEDRDRVLAASDEADRTGAPFDEEYRIYAKDGRIAWIRDEAVVVASSDDGRPLRVQGVMYDITRQKQAEQRLQEAEARYRSLVETLPVVTYVNEVTPEKDDVLRYVAPGMEQLTDIVPTSASISRDSGSR
jgi:PAS domain S-box-containing protein